MQALEKEKFDLILSDHGLPSFNSSEALKMARAKYPGIPFIIVSGRTPDVYIAEALKEGTNEFVPKDHFKDLPAVIFRVLAAKKG